MEGFGAYQMKQSNDNHVEGRVSCMEPIGGPQQKKKAKVR